MERALRKKLVHGSFGEVAPGNARRMSAIRGRGNRTTEARFRAMLVRAGIRGWSMQRKGITGKPDFFFSEGNVAVFLDGCFWHGCPICGHFPSVNAPFWKAKIEHNQRRDRKTDESLLRAGVTAIRFWEHELRNVPRQCIGRLLEVLATHHTPRRKLGN
jgi:DNA mismatch endonuclease (patch repair protein)